VGDLDRRRAQCPLRAAGRGRVGLTRHARWPDASVDAARPLT
jgi:hypothetical protein